MGRKTGIHTFGATAIGTVLALVTSVLVARYLGPEGRGLLLAFVFWPGLLRRIFYLSVNEATNYAVARARGEEGGEKMDQESRTALALHLIIIFPVTLFSLLLLPVVLDEARQQHLSLLLIFTFVATPFTLWDLYYNAVCQARYRVNEFNILRLVQPALYVVSLLALLVMNSFTVEGVLAAMVISTVGSVLLGIYFEGLSLPIWNWKRIWELIKFGLRIHGANMLLYISAEIDKFVIIMWMDNADAGIYAVALAVSLLGNNLIVQSFAVLAYPKISAVEDPKVQTGLIRDFTQLAVLFLVFINSTIAIASPWLVSVVFGQDFSSAIPLTIILLLTNTLQGIRQVIDRALRATLDVSPGMISEVVGLASFVAFVPIGMNSAGLVGVAWALAASRFLALIAIVFLTMQRRNLDARDLFGWHHSTAQRLLRETQRDLKQFFYSRSSHASPLKSGHIVMSLFSKGEQT